MSVKIWKTDLKHQVAEIHFFVLIDDLNSAIGVKSGYEVSQIFVFCLYKQKLFNEHQFGLMLQINFFLLIRTVHGVTFEGRK